MNAEILPDQIEFIDVHTTIKLINILGIFKIKIKNIFHLKYLPWGIHIKFDIDIK